MLSFSFVISSKLIIYDNRIKLKLTHEYSISFVHCKLGNWIVCVEIFVNLIYHTNN